MRNQDAALIFLHIPKTAGSTMYKVLGSHYAPDETITLDTPGAARFKTLPVAERAKYRLIQGHLYFGLHCFVPRASTYVTLLRQPIERALSFYYYARNTRDHYLYRVLNAEGLDLKTLLARNLTEELSNQQTRMLAGAPWDDEQRVVTSDALEQAKANLRSHFHVAGLLEEFDASLVLLHRAFEWPLRRYGKENVTKKKPQDASLDSKTCRLLEEANALDLELYDYARDLFHEQCRAAGNSFAAELNDFRRLNLAGSFRRIFWWMKDCVGRRQSHLLAL